MKKILNLSIKYKVAIVTLLVAIVPLLVFATISTYMYRDAIVSRSEKHIQENIEVMSDRIGTVFLDGELLSNNLTLAFSNIANDSSNKPVNKNALILKEMNQSILIFNGIESIVYIDGEGNYYTTNMHLLNSKQAVEESEYYGLLRNQKNGKTQLFDMVDDCMMIAEDEPVITMGKCVINTVSGKSMGYLFVNIDVDYLEKFVKNEISYYLLYDGNGQCVTRHQGQNMVDDAKMQADLYENPEISKLKYDRATYLVARDRVDQFDWTVIGVTNLDKFNVSSSELLSIYLLTGGIIALLLVIAMILVSSIITKPLDKLYEGADEIASGNLDVRFSFKSQDEIGRLGQIFNYMCERIKSLLTRVDEEAKSKREYELALIQEQVKPHFLYNTLDIIIKLIDMNKPKEAKRVTKKLASYYKNSLSGSEEIVTIDRELEIIKDYLDLQIMRYGDMFKYEIDVEDSVKELLIPKMTLQPLIENAIYHGLKYKEDWGTIKITAKHLKDHVQIMVEDNGIGMDEERLERVRKLKEDTSGGHFGVYAVNHRLKLYYGEDYGIAIMSRLGEGTQVSVRVPIKED